MDKSDLNMDPEYTPLTVDLNPRLCAVNPRPNLLQLPCFLLQDSRAFD